MVFTRAFAFTDIVESTALADRLGDRRFAELIRRHNALLRDLLARHRGTEAGFLGDGFLVAFERPADALDWAVEVQRAASAALAGAQLRIGMHAGSAVREGATWIGRDVIIARRLCERAGANEILASARVHALAGRRAASADPVVLSLKGLAGAHAACSVAW